MSEQMIDLEEMGQEDFAEFFTHLTSHALAAEHESVAMHLAQVDPSPYNIGVLIYGLAGSISIIANMLHEGLGHEHDGDDGPRAELHFGHIGDPADVLVAEAGGFPGKDAITELSSDEVPTPVRWAGQITSLAISGDNDSVQTMVRVIVDSYVADLRALDEDGDVEQVDALATVPALVSCFVGFASQAAAYLPVDEDEDTTGG